MPPIIAALLALFSLLLPQEVVTALRHPSSGGGGGIALVQGGDSAHTKAAAYGTTVTLAYPTNPTAGNCLMVSVSRSGPDSSSAISSTRETWTNAISNYGYSGGWLTTAGGYAQIYYATAAGGGSDTVSVTSPNAALGLQLWEFHGMTCAVDQTNLTGQSASSLTISTTAATTHANEVSMADFTDNTSNSDTITAGSPYAGYSLTGSTGGGSDSMVSEYKILSATGTQTATATDSASATSYQVIATFY